MFTHQGGCHHGAVSALTMDEISMVRMQFMEVVLQGIQSLELCIANMSGFNLRGFPHIENMNVAFLIFFEQSFRANRGDGFQ